MKIKAIDAVLKEITPGKEYFVKEQYGAGEYKNYLVGRDDGINAWLHHSHFIIIKDTPQIEVGSEWVHKDDNSFSVKILGVGTKYIFGIFNDINEELQKIVTFLERYKPKPKTVTMYFYRGLKGYEAQERPIDGFPHEFTREIEL